MDFLIKPLEGVYWGNKRILLKDNLDDVLSLCGDNYQKSMRDEKTVLYLFHSSLQIYFDVNDSVEFIMFGGGYNIELEVSIYGINPFKTKENELFEVLKENNNGEVMDTEDGYSYEFKNISVGIWRENKPEKIKEFIDEIVLDNNLSKEVKEQLILEETIKLSYWETLGIGVENYYA